MRTREFQGRTYSHDSSWRGMDLWYPVDSGQDHVLITGASGPTAALNAVSQLTDLDAVGAFWGAESGQHKVFYRV